MPLLTPAQLQEVLQIIRDHHTAFIANVIGPDVLEPEIKARLAKKGLLNVKVASIEDAYLYGQLLGQLDDPKVQNMSYEQFRQHIRKNPIPLTEVEKDAVQAAKMRAGQFARGLGNRVEQQTGIILIEADAGLRQQMRDEIRTKTAENIARRESVRQLKSDLGWATRDWARDWDRIAITEKHESMQQGVSDQIAKRWGSDTEVFKRPMPDACEHCKRLHLGPDGHPRIFKLSELEANGSNVGRKVAQWMAVVGAVHPHCQCQLMRMPPGWGFNDEGQLEPGAEGGIRYTSAGEMKAALEMEADLMKAIRGGGNVVFQNLPIFVENPAGSVRKWTDQDGNTGETVMMYAYGEIEGTEGNDGDPIDVFIGPDPKAKMAFIVHQQDPSSGRYDEDKVMLGFPSEKHAVAAYRAHYNKPGFDVACSPMPMDHFKRWIKVTGPNHMSLQKGPRLVIPFQKALKTRVGANEGAATSQAGNRNPSTMGTAVNYEFPVPEHEPPKAREQGQSPDPRLVLEEWQAKGNPGLHVPRDKYELPNARRMETQVTPDPKEVVTHDLAGDPTQEQDIEFRREKLETRKKRRAKKPPNRTPVTEDDVKRAKAKEGDADEATDQS